MKALFLYVGLYGCSHADELMYLGILPDGSNPLDMIRAQYEYEPAPETVEWGEPRASLTNRQTGDKYSLFSPKEDGETSYLIFDLDQPGVFISGFEHEGGGKRFRDKTRLKDSDFV